MFLLHNEEVVYWRPKILLEPFRRAGRAFVRDLARLYQAYADASTLECIALKAGTVLQCLLLQKSLAIYEQIQRPFHPSRMKAEIMDGW